MMVVINNFIRKLPAMTLLQAFPIFFFLTSNAYGQDLLGAEDMIKSFMDCERDHGETFGKQKLTQAVGSLLTSARKQLSWKKSEPQSLQSLFNQFQTIEFSKNYHRGEKDGVDDDFSYEINKNSLQSKFLPTPLYGQVVADFPRLNLYADAKVPTKLKREIIFSSKTYLQNKKDNNKEIQEEGEEMAANLFFGIYQHLISDTKMSSILGKLSPTEEINLKESIYQQISKALASRTQTYDAPLAMTLFEYFSQASETEQFAFNNEMVESTISLQEGILTLRNSINFNLIAISSSAAGEDPCQNCADNSKRSELGKIRGSREMTFNLINGTFSEDKFKVVKLRSFFPFQNKF